MNEINEMGVFIMANYSTSLLGFLGDVVNVFTEDVNPRTRDKYDDYYAPRPRVVTYDVELVISADSRYQSSMSYDFVKTIIDNYDMNASERGRVNYNVPQRRVQCIINNAQRRGFNVVRNGNVIEIVDNRNNADVIININTSYRANDRW